MSAAIEIVPATAADFPEIWRIFQDVLEGGETYSYAPGVSEAWAKDYWMTHPDAAFVAKEDGEVRGAYALRKNRDGNGDHIANASFMVDAAHRGKGIGRKLGQHCIDEARRRGYRGIVYNFVVSTNTWAVNLWKSLGYQIIGTLPEGFRHKKLGKFVDVYMMYQKL